MILMGRDVFLLLLWFAPNFFHKQNISLSITTVT